VRWQLLAGYTLTQGTGHDGAGKTIQPAQKIGFPPAILNISDACSPLYRLHQTCAWHPNSNVYKLLPVQPPENSGRSIAETAAKEFTFFNAAALP